MHDAFAEHKQTDFSVYTDFSKAFDRVGGSLSFLKLGKLGFSDTMVQWLVSELFI